MRSRQRLSSLKTFDDFNISCLFELAKMNRQIALGSFQHVFKLIKIGSLGVHQIGHDPQAQAPVDGIIQPIDVEACHVYFLASFIMVSPAPDMRTIKAMPIART